MRQLSCLLAAAALALASPGAANAALLFWDGTVNLRLGTMPEAIVTGSGVATVNGSSGLGSLSTLRLAGGITIVGNGGHAANSQYPTVMPVTDPDTPTIGSLWGTGDLRTGTLGQISGGGPLTQDTLPFVGNFKICLLFAGCGSWLDIPIATTTGAGQPGTRGMGIGGVITINGFGPGMRLSIQHAPWTIGSAAVTGVFTENNMIPDGPLKNTTTARTTGYAHGPASGTSTAKTGGAVQVVSPTVVWTSLEAPSNYLAAIHTLRLTFVPEPGLILLLASGVGGLALLGRHRLRR